MEEIIRQIVLELGYITFDMLDDNNASNNGVVNILEHHNDINFILEQMTPDIDILITYNPRTISIAVKNNNEDINRLTTILSGRFKMQFFGNTDTISLRQDFPFRVITLMRDLD